MEQNITKSEKCVTPKPTGNRDFYPRISQIYTHREPDTGILETYCPKRLLFDRLIHASRPVSSRHQPEVLRPYRLRPKTALPNNVPGGTLFGTVWFEPCRSGSPSLEHPPTQFPSLDLSKSVKRATEVIPSTESPTSTRLWRRCNHRSRLRSRPLATLQLLVTTNWHLASLEGL